MQLKVNGKPCQIKASKDTPLLWALRDELGLTGTKYGCGMALCGACTVMVNDQPVRSCSTPVQSVANAKVTTIEGLQDRYAQAIIQAWQELDVVQCGYCQSGQIVSAAALLQKHPKPTDAEIDAAMAGNLCRCATYSRIRAAIHLAASKLAK